MKKSMLWCGVALLAVTGGMVQADLDFTPVGLSMVGGYYEVTPGETITVDISTTSPIAAGFTLSGIVIDPTSASQSAGDLINIAATTLGTVQGFSMVLDPLNGQVESPLVTPAGEEIIISRISAAAGPATGVIYNDFSFTINNNPGLAGSTFMLNDLNNVNFVWTSPAGWTGIAGITQVDLAATDMAGLNFKIVPEPMTLALLGLGGLILHRRRT